MEIIMLTISYILAQYGLMTLFGLIEVLCWSKPYKNTTAVYKHILKQPRYIPLWIGGFIGYIIMLIHIVKN